MGVHLSDSPSKTCRKVQMTVSPAAGMQLELKRKLTNYYERNIFKIDEILDDLVNRVIGNPDVALGFSAGKHNTTFPQL